jgi:hypothetical protein
VQVEVGGSRIELPSPPLTLFITRRSLCNAFAHLIPVQRDENMMEQGGRRRGSLVEDVRTTAGYSQRTKRAR